MLLKARFLKIEAEKPIVILNRDDAEDLGIRALERIELRFRGKKAIAITNLAEKIIKKGEIGLYMEITKHLDVIPGDKISVTIANSPKSLEFIRKKLNGQTLQRNEIRSIIEDTINHNLSDIELTAFVTSLYTYGMSMEEIAALSISMAETGKILKLKKKPVYDKHSIGGCPGDKTSILAVPIVAAAGLTIPKTSSRAITSPAGTADRFECLAPVNLDLEEVERVVEKTNACLVWGGSVDLAPADDIFIKIEYPLSIDPFLLPSVMSKKKAVNAKYVVIDMPTGRETKVRTAEEFEILANKFVQLGRKLGMRVECVSTFAEQPIGFAVGPALEAREALQTLKSGRGPSDLVDKATTLAGVLLEFAGAKNGKKAALDILKSGKAYKKLKEIIEAQGGNPEIRNDDILVGRKIAEVKSNRSGHVLWISNKAVDIIAREAGAPKDKGAGVYFKKKLGDKVKKGETLFVIYAEKYSKFKNAVNLANKIDVMGIGQKMRMKLEEFPGRKDEEERYFILER